eukprot:jgi/Botrbrau1/2831/Bobra.0125s0038.2
MKYCLPLRKEERRRVASSEMEVMSWLHHVQVGLKKMSNCDAEDSGCPEREEQTGRKSLIRTLSDLEGGSSLGAGGERLTECKAGGSHRTGAGEVPNQDRIFVSVAAYRDPDTANTLQHLFLQATKPERVRVGVVWQLDFEKDAAFASLDVIDARFRQQVREIRLHYTEARGPCKARALAQSLWEGEAFFLQIDSHTRFRRGWDVSLRAMLEEAEALSTFGKAVLSTYPSGFEDAEDQDALPTLLCAKGFGPDGILRLKGCRIRPSALRNFPVAASDGNDVDAQSDGNRGPNVGDVIDIVARVCGIRPACASACPEGQVRHLRDPDDALGAVSRDPGSSQDPGLPPGLAKWSPGISLGPVAPGTLGLLETVCEGQKSHGPPTASQQAVLGGLPGPQGLDRSDDPTAGPRGDPAEVENAPLGSVPVPECLRDRPMVPPASEGLLDWRERGGSGDRRAGRVCRSLFWAAGFSFSRSAFLQEVPYDPDLPWLFFGEETAMLARMWTCGWDVYCPLSPVVFHNWSRSGRPTFSADVPADQGAKAASQAKVRALLRGERGGKHGLGTQRSIQQFWESIGVDFVNEKISPAAARGGLPDDSALLSDLS